ncbi:hypothetical protein D3C78_1521930 [compost metagenome]
MVNALLTQFVNQLMTPIRRRMRQQTLGFKYRAGPENIDRIAILFRQAQMLVIRIKGGRQHVALIALRRHFGLQGMPFAKPGDF